MQIETCIQYTIPLVLEMQPDILEINNAPDQKQTVKYAAVIASPGYPNVSDRVAAAYLYKMPAGAYITYDIFIPTHQSFSNSQSVTLKVSKSRNINFDGTVSSSISFKQTGSSTIQISMEHDSVTRKYPVFLLKFEGK